MGLLCDYIVKNIEAQIETRAPRPSPIPSASASGLEVFKKIYKLDASHTIFGGTYSASATSIDAVRIGDILGIPNAKENTPSKIKNPDTNVEMTIAEIRNFVNELVKAHILNP